MIKLLMVLALNPQSSRQKENDLRARPMWNLKKGPERCGKAHPSPKPSVLTAPGASQLREKGGPRTQRDLSSSH